MVNGARVASEGTEKRYASGPWPGEWSRTTVTVTTLGEEFVRGAEGECLVSDFPLAGETALLTWQQNSQNFVITDVE